MSRINAVDLTTAEGAVRKNFDAVRSRLGVVPNMIRTMAQSPRVLEGYLGFSGALMHGRLPASLQEQIALAIAEANGCDYCLSAHSVLGRGAGLTDAQIAASREGRSADPKPEAALRFALEVLQHRGGVSNDQVANVRAAGFTDEEIAEIVAHVALNAFTNFFNRVCETDIDFPQVTRRAA